MGKDLTEVRGGAMQLSGGDIVPGREETRAEITRRGCLAYSRDSTETWVAGMERIRRRTTGDEVKAMMNGWIE